ncbi:MAG: VCBS repeat-containing protein [Opitutales bacterium]|nr:VCBS repeat-containing protein [Opitutales bacterium]MCH8539208.1 VCBS repeat-containing protein [Opitutales bacterium]
MQSFVPDLSLIKKTLAPLLGLGVSVSVASAYVNPNFTPVDLTNQAATIVLMEVGEGDPQEGPVSARKVDVLKGEVDWEEVTISFEELFDSELDEFIDHYNYDPARPAVFFAGDFDEASEGGGDVAGSLLHIGNEWFSLTEENGTWFLLEIDPNMLPVWNGGSAMLANAVRYFNAASFPEMPVEGGITWGEPEIVEGGFLNDEYRLYPLDLHGELPLSLFIASPDGDRIFRMKGDSMVELTEDVNLSSTSESIAPGDFTGDGNLDLISVGPHGASLLVNDGESFVARPLDLPETELYLGAATIDAEGPGAGLVLATGGHPVLITFDEAGEVYSKALPGGEFEGTFVKAPHDIMVADLTGNSYNDIAIPLPEGLLVYRQNEEGWEEPVLNEGFSMGTGPIHLHAADMDGDGLLDILSVGQNATLFLHNQGDGKFLERRQLAGEPSYITAPNAVAAATVDLNNNALPDLLVFYPRAGVHYFFARGFFSYAFALDADPNGAFSGLTSGQKAGTAGIFTEDGTYSMATVLNDGRLALLPQVVDMPGPLAARLVLPGDHSHKGPVVVRGENDDRELPAWLVTPGGAGSQFGAEVPGPMTVRWQFPGGDFHERELILDDGVKTFSLPQK